MDEFREIEVTDMLKGIFLEEWTLMPTKEKDVALKTLSWCSQNLQKFTKEVKVQKLWQDKLLDAIEGALGERYGKTLEEVLAKGRKRDKVDLRNKIFDIYHRHSGKSLLSMSRMFGYDHSTLINSLRNVENMSRYEEEYRNSLNELEETIKQKLL